MKRFVRWQVLLCVSAVLFLFSAVEPASGADSIKIGGLFELTGFLAPIGKDAQQGALIAIEQEGGKLQGKPIEFIIEDTACDVTTTMDKARKLVETDKVKIIVGPIFGSSTAAMGGYLDKVRIPMISIAPLEDKTIFQNKWCFSMVGTDGSICYPMGVYAAEKLGLKNVATIASDFDAGHEFIKGFENGFESKGGKVIQRQWTPPGSTNMIPFLVAIDKKADALITWWPGGEAFAGFKHYKEIGINIPILAPEDGGILGNPLANKGLGAGAIGAHTTLMYSYLAKTPGNKEFVTAYKKKYGVVPSPLAGCGYVAVRTAIEGIKKTGSDNSSDKLKDALTALKINTVYGPLTFNKWRVGSHTTPIVKIDKNFIPQIVAEYRVNMDVVNNKFVYKLEK